MESDSSPLIYLGAGLAFILLYFFFLISAVALTRSRPRNIRNLWSAKNSGAVLGRLLKTRLDHYLLSSQIGIFLTAFISGYFLISFSLRLVVTLGLQERAGMMFEAAALVVICFMVILVVLAMTQLARDMVFSRAEKVLCVLAWPLFWVSKIFWPLISLVGLFARALKLVVTVDVPVERELAISAQELTEMAQLSRDAGTGIEDEEKEMIQGVFTFGETVVREVMTPRKDIIYVEDSTSLEEAAEVFVEEGISRILVVGKDLDDVKGILLSKDLLSCFKSDSKVTLGSLIRPAYFASNTKNIDELLQEFRKERVHIAVVLDEHGGVDGLVTLEDLVEEIVGEISDEYDAPTDVARDNELERSREGLLVDGSMLVDDINSEYELNLPEGEYDTIAGFVIHQLGRLPSGPEEITYNGLRIKVEDVSQNRITRLRISKADSRRRSRPHALSNGAAPKSPESKTGRSAANHN